MDFKKLRKQVAQGKTFSTIIPSLGIEVLGKVYDLDDEITIAGLFEMDDMKFFFAGLANLIAKKYSISPDIMNSLTAVDIQYLTAQLKKHSDGDIVKITFNCPHESCNSKLSTEINLNEIKIENEKNFKRLFTLSDTLKMEVGLPAFEDYFSIINEFKDVDEKNIVKITEKNIELFKYSIKSFYNGDSVEVVDSATRTSKDFDDYVKSDLREQYYKFQEYLNETPSISYNKKIVCSNCKKEIKLDLDDFFYSML